MRRLTATFAIAACSAAWLCMASVASAQPPGGPGPGASGGPGGGGRGSSGPPGGGMMGFGAPMMMGGSPITLLGNEAVREELGLTKKQTPQAEKLVESYREEMQKQLRSSGFDPAQFGQMSDDERTKTFAELREKQEKTVAKLNSKFEPRLKKLLKPEQIKRLKQIGYQSAGIMAIQNNEVAKELGITKDQQAQIQEIHKESGEQMRELFASMAPPGGGFGNGFGGGFGSSGNRPGADSPRGGKSQDQGGAPRQGGPKQGPGGNGQAQGGFPGGQEFQERFQKMRKLNEDRDAKVLAVLTDDQRQKFDGLKGDPFDLASLRPRGFGPPPEGQRQGAGDGPPADGRRSGNERAGRQRRGAD